ncbi:MAG: hypothetical protein Kow0092_12210 [Deferrisomatales bacterium]
MAARKRLGEILKEGGLINDTQLKAALHSQRTWGGKLGSTLVRMGFAREEDILRCLSAQLRLPSVDFRKVKISPRTLTAVPMRIAEKYNVIPVALKEELGKKKSVILAMSDPTNLEAISEIEFQAGVTVRPVVATESSITRAIDQYYRNRRVAPTYGHEEKVDVAQVDAGEEMVILSRGDEVKLGRFQGVDARDLVQALIRVLEEKGVIEAADVERVLREK